MTSLRRISAIFACVQRISTEASSEVCEEVCEANGPRIYVPKPRGGGNGRWRRACDGWEVEVVDQKKPPSGGGAMRTYG
jgi:hypothetical protein